MFKNVKRHFNDVSVIITILRFSPLWYHEAQTIFLEVDLVYYFSSDLGEYQTDSCDPLPFREILAP